MFAPLASRPCQKSRTRLCAAAKSAGVAGFMRCFASGTYGTFIASIAVPFSKLIALTYLLVSVQRRSVLALRERTRLYRVLEFVGRWSMIDIYVAALLTALVQFGGLMSIQAGPGAIAFGAVVVLTMFAAESFDPRLIWDPVEAASGR